MNRDFYNLVTTVRNGWCDGCDINECKSCVVKDVLRKVENLDAMYGNATAVESSDGCHICKDKNGKTKDVMFFDAANNMRFAKVCPECGRKM